MLLKLYLYAKDGCTISQSRYLSDKLKKKNQYTILFGICLVQCLSM